MRIVYLVNSLSHISGGTRVITEHVNRLSEFGHDVEVWLYQYNTQQYFDLKVRVGSVQNQNMSEPDVVVVTDQVFLPLVATHRKTKPTFLLIQHDEVWIAAATNNGLYVDNIPSYASYFQNGPWQIITVSKWLADVVEKRYGVRSTVVSNGVDTKLFRRKRPLLHADGPSLLLYYDPQPWKGFDLAATAALEVKKQIPQLSILLLGAFFPPTLNQDGTASRFTFPATLFCAPDQTDLARIYSSATIFVCASWREGFGLPALEAMACGTAVVTTDNEGSREYAKHNYNAYVVPTMDTNALIDGLLTVLTKQILRKKLAENGRITTKSMDWKQQIARLNDTLS